MTRLRSADGAVVLEVELRYNHLSSVMSIHKGDTFHVAEFPANDASNPICLLLHNGHFWPIRHVEAPAITLWKGPTFTNFAAATSR